MVPVQSYKVLAEVDGQHDSKFRFLKLEWIRRLNNHESWAQMVSIQQRISHPDIIYSTPRCTSNVDCSMYIFPQYFKAQIRLPANCFKVSKHTRGCPSHSQWWLHILMGCTIVIGLLESEHQILSYDAHFQKLYRQFPNLLRSLYAYCDPRCSVLPRSSTHRVLDLFSVWSRIRIVL